MTVIQNSTEPGQAGPPWCEIADHGGPCIRDAVVRITNADADAVARLEGQERPGITVLACAGHISAAFLAAGRAGRVKSPCFAVEAVGTLAAMIDALVPAPYIA